MHMTMTRNDKGQISMGLAVALGIAGLVVLVVGAFAIQWITAEPRGALDQREQTVADGDYRIAQYDKFFNLCGDIQATEDKIRNTEARPVDGKNGTAGGFTQTQKDAILLALRNTRAEMIRSYNADATKAGTQGQFRDSNLPYQIDIESENTVCAA